MTAVGRDYDAQRLRFRPSKVRVLFIGESRPASGKFFYYTGSQLYDATKEAFYDAVPSLLMEANFLRSFAALGCYLDDLCHEPVNDLPLRSTERMAAREAGIEPLAERLGGMNPPVVITVMNAIAPHVTRALALTRLTPAARHDLPFPREGNQRDRYVEGLRTILRKLHTNGGFP